MSNKSPPDRGLLGPSPWLRPSPCREEGRGSLTNGERSQKATAGGREMRQAVGGFPWDAGPTVRRPRGGQGTITPGAPPSLRTQPLRRGGGVRACRDSSASPCACRARTASAIMPLCHGLERGFTPHWYGETPRCKERRECAAHRGPPGQWHLGDTDGRSVGGAARACRSAARAARTREKTRGARLLLIRSRPWRE